MIKRTVFYFVYALILAVLIFLGMASGFEGEPSEFNVVEVALFSFGLSCFLVVIVLLIVKLDSWSQT